MMQLAQTAYNARVYGEVSELAEGARLLSEYTGLNLYREFKSLPLRQESKGNGELP